MGRSSGRERKQEHNECGRVWGVFMHIIHERRSGGGGGVGNWERERSTQGLERKHTVKESHG